MELHEQQTPTIVYTSYKTGTTQNDVKCIECVEELQRPSHMCYRGVPPSSVKVVGNALLKILFFEMCKDLKFVDSVPQWYYTVTPLGSQCSNLTLSSWFGSTEKWYCTHIARQCCDQLTAVKTGYPLTSITWPVSRAQLSTCRGGVFFYVSRREFTSFQIITGSSFKFS